MGRRTTETKEEFRTRLAELTEWRTATRDDLRVAEAVHGTREMDRVHMLDETAFFDELFHFIKDIGAWRLLGCLDPETRRRPLHPFLVFVLFMMMRCVGGVQSMLATQEVLLTDEALMGLLGFNAMQVRLGSNKRDMHRRRKPTGIRGPFSYETVADNMVAVKPERLVELFNGVVRCLAAGGFFPKKIHAVLDTTDDEATPNYETDDGRPVPKVTRDKRPDVRYNRHAKKIPVTVWGWKVWVVWEPVSQIPLAILLDDINVSENERAEEVIEQANENVKGYAEIVSLALDRGFLDGKLLSRIDKLPATVYIPAKSGMGITADARAIARRAAAMAERGEREESCRYATREEEVRRGSGKKAWVEKRKTTLVGVRDLPCGWWKADGKTSADNSKDFQPKLVNASVVLEWAGVPADEEEEVVILTTDPSEDPFVAFDAYDDRSLIENTCNREAKESWFLEHHPKRSEAGVRVQAYFVFTCMALVAAFRMYKQKAEEAERRGKETGISRYRRQLLVENRDKVIVFSGQHFGIFRSYELVLLLGAKVWEHAFMGETAETVLARCAAGRKRKDTS